MLSKQTRTTAYRHALSIKSIYALLKAWQNTQI